MAPWTPTTDKIGPNEHIGCRLFDKPQLIGAPDQKPRLGLRLEHFLAKRDAGETSLDRLGLSGVDKRVRSYLGQRAIKAAGEFREPRQFNGWAVAHIKVFRKPPHGAAVSVVPSPVDGTGLDENNYHAHALPEGRSYYEMANHLLYLFSEHGSTESYKHELSWRDRWRAVGAWVRARLRQPTEE